MIRLHGLFLVTSVLAVAKAADLTPATVAAFDRYMKRTEERLAQRAGSADFLWLDDHPKAKSLVWLNESMIEPYTLDKDEETDVPDGAIQDWVGAIFLPGATLERVRDLVLDYANYKNFFKPQVVDSRLDKRDGDHFDAFLRIQKKQLRSTAINVSSSAQFTAVNPSRAYVVSRSTHIGEVKNPKKNGGDGEVALGNESGDLRRLNLYWRFQQADNGVYTEVELVALSREAGGLSPGRLLNRLQSLPRGLVEGFVEGLHQAFPPNHR